MSSTTLPLNDGLAATTRLRRLASIHPSPGVLDWTWLVAMGAAAAVASAAIDFNLRVPGHAILRVVLPIAAGLAVVPRRGAGTVMGGVALAVSLGLRARGMSGDGLSLGALTSLTAIGPLLDWTLRRTRGGWRQYAAFALAGFGANLLALLVKATSKAAGWEHVGARGLWEWLPQASFTYAASGIIAGFLSGVILFYGREKTGSDPGERVP